MTTKTGKPGSKASGKSGSSSKSTRRSSTSSERDAIKLQLDAGKAGLNSTASGEVFGPSVFLKLTVGWIGFKRGVDSDAVTVKRADKRTLTVHKKIIDCPEHRAIDHVRSRAQNYLSTVAIPAPSHIADRTYVVPASRLEEVIERLRGYEKERREAVEKFIDVYAEAKKRAKELLQDLWDENEYPSDNQVRAAFYFEWRIVEEQVPAALREVDAGLYVQEQRKLREKLQEAAEMVKWAMRAELQELMAHLADRLAPDENGERKVFRKSAVENVTEWLDYFVDKNTVSPDDALSQVAERCKKIVGGVDVDGLKDDAKYQAAVKADVERVKVELDKMMEKRPARLIGGEV